MGVADLQSESLTKRKGAAPLVAPTVGTWRSALSAVGMVLLLSLLVGVLAYQAPPQGRVLVGWVGDRLFLATTAGLGADAVARGDLFADDLTPDAPTGRSRWTRQHALLQLPHVGAGAELDLTVTAQGWPDDVVGASVAQPVVTVRADGVPIGEFTPSSGWAEYTFRVPAVVRTSGDLRLDFASSHTFTDTASFGVDPRPKGFRLAEVRVRAVEASAPPFYPPAWRAVGLLAASALLLYLLLNQIVRSTPVVYVGTTLGVALAATGLAVTRIWMGAALSVALGVLGALLLIVWYPALLRFVRALVRRYVSGAALGYGLVAAALVLFVYALAQGLGWLSSSGVALFLPLFPDSLLIALLGTGLLALVLVLGREGLPQLSDRIVAWLGSHRGSLIVLGGFAVIWLAYQAWVIARMSYVGHADYADNAVVARNLAAGRGWVVDYVTQFYHLIEGVTRPQETWPLLQPVWIAPFFLVFGPEAWAAKLPNLFFNVILLVLIYVIGTHFWDRRVGVTAAILTLTNFLFFRLTIYVTNDLGFVVFSLGAIFLLYVAVPRPHEKKRYVMRGGLRPPTPPPAGAVTPPRAGVATPPPAGVDATEQVLVVTPPRAGAATPPPTGVAGTLRAYLREVGVNRALVAAGVLTGLMMLQKPSGAMLALGMGLWFLWQQMPADWRALLRRPSLTRLAALLVPVAVWTAIALVVLSPYLVRNLSEFGKPVYSTESYDAWVLGYRGSSGDAWEEIYRVFTPELGGPGLPDRSWILRWGFDKTGEKFATQVRELRDYLMPVWRGLPDDLAWFFGGNERKNILSGLGAWLALIGVIGALRFRRRLLGLLAFTFAPYMVFMLTYWRTDEHRYWVMLLPWLALLASWIIWAGYDRLAAVSDRRWAPLGLILVVVALHSIIGFSRPDIANKVRNEPVIWQPDLAAYAWLQANTTPEAVVMTRIPWQFNWHVERPAVMIPNTGDRDLLLTIARHYDAQYLVLENQQRVKGDAGRLLAPLMDHSNQVGDVIDGFELIYASPTDDFRAFVYRMPPVEQGLP
ncbi:ArnT family glycosyltransferase [Candidatus Chloroploca asiatica]|nr:glycosyltransferase family 39 protein [Candidatus Chloroploca asiatica]